MSRRVPHRLRLATALRLVLLAIGLAGPVASSRLGGFALALASTGDSPLGLWKTFDDRTGQPRALVRIYEEKGRLFGRIEQSFTPGAEHRVCRVCTDERRNQPIIGLLIIRNLEHTRDEWSGGDILDPDSGSVYRCKVRLDQGGTRLIVRGYIGFSLLGRSQTWQRQNDL